MELNDSSLQLPATLGNSKLATFLNADNEHVQVVMPVENAAPTTGSLAAVGNAVSINVDNHASVVVAISGTFSIAMAFEASIDGATWYSIRALRSSTGNIESTASSLTTALSWAVDVFGWRFFRVRCTTYTSGSCGVTILGSSRPASYQSADITPLAAGSATIGNVGLVGKTTGGTLNHSLISAATTNATLIKSSAGTLYGFHVANTGAVWRFLKVFAKATAPVPGTDVPVMTFALGPGQDRMIDFGDIGAAVATGIGIAVTGGVATNDATAVAANEVTIVTQYT